jgi:DNA-directed RNA polymerase specialized sigma24 family protein
MARATRESTSGQWFLTTHWSVVLSARDLNPSLADDAREELCKTYWGPIHSFVRWQGYSPEDAKDLTQAFFAKLLEKDFWARANPEKGRMRSFLLTALKQFLSDERDRAHAAKRGGGAAVVSLDDSNVKEQVANLDNSSVERSFDQKWAAAILDAARARLRGECTSSGKSALFEQVNLLGEAEAKSVTYAEVAARLGMGVSGVKTAVSRLRQRYGELVREEVAKTVAESADVDAEIAYLLSIIAN